MSAFSEFSKKASNNFNITNVQSNETTKPNQTPPTTPPTEKPNPTETKPK